MEKKYETRVVAADDSKEFETKTNLLAGQGWEILPESLRCGVSTTSNAWDSKAQTRRVFAVVLRREVLK